MYLRRTEETVEGDQRSGLTAVEVPQEHVLQCPTQVSVVPPQLALLLLPSQCRRTPSQVIQVRSPSFPVVTRFVMTDLNSSVSSDLGPKDY